jgi:hypothetical protein
MSGSQQPINCWVVVIDELDPPELLGPMSRNQLIEKLRRMNGQRVRVFPFEGQPCLISNGPRRHLLTSDGGVFPLFDMTDELGVDPLGLLYDPDTAPKTNPPDTGGQVTSRNPWD